MKKTGIVILLIGFLIAADMSGSFHIGPISEIKKRIKGLKNYVDEQEAEKEEWKVLGSALSGIYTSGKYKFVISNSPYIITGAVQFPDSDIDIEAGVNIYLSSGDSISFDGVDDVPVISFNGTKTLPVTFTTETVNPDPLANRGEWEYVKIINCSSTLLWCNFLFGQTGLNITGSADIDNCSFKYNSATGLKIGDNSGASAYTATVTNCIISDNGTDTDADTKADTGNGLVIDSPAAVVSVTYSVLEKNGESAIRLNNLSDSHTFKNNNIYQMQIPNSYLVTNRSSDTNATMTYNWWNSTSTTTISSHIKDRSSDGVLYGPVTYMPVETSTVTAAGLE